MGAIFCCICGTAMPPLIYCDTHGKWWAQCDECGRRGPHKGSNEEAALEWNRDMHSIVQAAMRGERK